VHLLSLFWTQLWSWNWYSIECQSLIRSNASPLRNRDMMSPGARIVSLCGDVSQPLLGLQQEVYYSLSLRAIAHAASAVKFIEGSATVCCEAPTCCPCSMCWQSLQHALLLRIHSISSDAQWTKIWTALPQRIAA